jgi:hypothetical protein
VIIVENGGYKHIFCLPNVNLNSPLICTVGGEAMGCFQWQNKGSLESAIFDLGTGRCVSQTWKHLLLRTSATLFCFSFVKGTVSRDFDLYSEPWSDYTVLLLKTKTWLFSPIQNLGLIIQSSSESWPDYTVLLSLTIQSSSKPWSDHTVLFRTLP